jgi:hypothetical protein
MPISSWYWRCLLESNICTLSLVDICSVLLQNMVPDHAPNTSNTWCECTFQFKPPQSTARTTCGNCSLSTLGTPIPKPLGIGDTITENESLLSVSPSYLDIPFSHWLCVLLHTFCHLPRPPWIPVFFGQTSKAPVPPFSSWPMFIGYPFMYRHRHRPRPLANRGIWGVSDEYDEITLPLLRDVRHNQVLFTSSSNDNMGDLPRKPLVPRSCYQVCFLPEMGCNFYCKP